MKLLKIAVCPLFLQIVCLEATSPTDYSLWALSKIQRCGSWSLLVVKVVSLIQNVIDSLSYMNCFYGLLFEMTEKEVLTGRM